MLRRVTISITLLILISMPVFAAQTMTFDWEDGTSTCLLTYLGANVVNTDEYAQSGTRSLKIWEDPLGSTPYAVVWWVTGCAQDDTIDANFYVYDTTPAASPSGRIWAHYTDDPMDIDSYAGSASGNSTYSDGTGWSNLAFQWVFDSDGGLRDGIAIEARIYSGSAGSQDSIIWVDNTYIRTSSDLATIHNAAGAVPVELASFTASADIDGVTLMWNTASEKDNLGFNILRALGATEPSLVNLSIIPGSGTTLEPRDYSYFDGNVDAGQRYRYWLEQVDFQGTTELFGPVNVSIPATLPETVFLSASPQPVESDASIQLNIPSAGHATVSLYDLQGHEVTTIMDGAAQGGMNSISWDRGSVASGTYMIRAATEFGEATTQIILR